MQRVLEARVDIDGNTVGRCRSGLLVLVAAHRDDTDQDAARLASRVAKIRIFNDTAGKMNLSLDQTEKVSGPRVLVVSNFTLYGDCSSRRPGFSNSAGYDEGKRLCELFLSELDHLGVACESGVFGADMQVHLVNDGPVTLIVDSR